MDQICAHCLDEKDLVTPDNGVSVPGTDGHVVVVHNRCISEWILKQSGELSNAAGGL
jgi:hypothetical protein